MLNETTTVLSSDEVFFPKTPSMVPQDMRAMKWIIYGPPGIGKSTFVSQARDVLFLTTDDGLKFMPAMHRPIQNWFVFKKYVKALCAEKPSQYKAIAIDNIDGVFKMCRKYICEKRGIEHQSDEQWGKAYDITSSEFELEFMKIVGLQKYGLFFISHSVEREVKTRLSSITRTVPTMPGQAYKILTPLADIMAYYGFDGMMNSDGEQVRRMYFQPTENIDAKDRTKKLPESIAIPDPETKNGFEMVERLLLEDEDRPVNKPKIKLKSK